MTYARKMAAEWSEFWLKSTRLHQVDIADVEELVSDVVERCAQEADDGDPNGDCDEWPGNRVRALATSPGTPVKGEL